VSCCTFSTPICTSNTFDIGYRKPKIRIFGYKIWQKSGFLSFCASESILPPTLWVIHFIWCNSTTYMCCWSLKTLIIPHFWPYNRSKRRISILWSFWIRSISSPVSYPIYLKPYHYLPVLLESQSLHYSAFLGDKIGQKGEFPSFRASKSGLSSVQWVIKSTWSHIITYLHCWRLRALIIPLFLTIKSVKKANFLLSELLNQVYLLSSESHNPPEAISLLTCAFWVS